MLHGFPPIASEQARVLVLGSMPGEESLRKHEYYGHPRNHFWPILYAVFGKPGAKPDEVYEERLAFAQRHGVAIWDVLRTCERKGSLDADIREPEVNDFAAFFTEHPGLERILFNGKAAYRLFHRYVPEAAVPQVVLHVELPSTSPAMTASFEKKLSAWRPALVPQIKAP